MKSTMKMLLDLKFHIPDTVRGILKDVTRCQVRESLFPAIMLFSLFGLLLPGMTSCVTVTPAEPPPLVKREGVAPKVAMLPWNTNDKAVARHAYKALTTCLEERNIFQFVPREKVEEIVKDGGYDLTKVFGPSEQELQEIAGRLDVDYTMNGAVSVIKDLTFAGWRKDISSEIRMNRAADGSRVDSWLSNTSMTFTDARTALDADRMADSVMNNLCSRIIESAWQD